MPTPALLPVLLLACTPTDPVDSGATADPAACGTDDALLSCSAPTMDPDHYVAQGLAYFDTMDRRVDAAWPPYGEQVARWEWPPWLKLTAYGRENIEVTDALLKLYPSIVEDRDCRYFDTQPFARCTVVFYYDDHDGKPCPIYEEFSFNEAGEITWIEAWSDVDGLRPITEEDPWGERDGFPRLADRIPGLGTPTGALDLDGAAMQAAVAEDADVADFVARASDWYDTWLAEYQAAGDALWEVGCGW